MLIRRLRIALIILFIINMEFIILKGFSLIAMIVIYICASLLAYLYLGTGDFKSKGQKILIISSGAIVIGIVIFAITIVLHFQIF